MTDWEQKNKKKTKKVKKRREKGPTEIALLHTKGDPSLAGSDLVEIGSDGLAAGPFHS